MLASQTDRHIRSRAEILFFSPSSPAFFVPAFTSSSSFDIALSVGEAQWLLFSIDGQKAAPSQIYTREIQPFPSQIAYFYPFLHWRIEDAKSGTKYGI